MGSTPIAGYTVPDNGSDWADTGASVAQLAAAVEKDTVMKFATSAARNQKITSANARLGMFVWLDTPGNYFKLTAIGSDAQGNPVLTWSEMGPVPWKCALFYNVTNNGAAGGVFRSGSEDGVGAPPAGSTFGTFGTGTNGPTTPAGAANGDYYATLTVQCKKQSDGSAIGSGGTYRAWASIRVDGVEFGRVPFGPLEDTTTVAALLQNLPAGKEITGVVFQNSGGAATGSVTWRVSRVGL